MMNNFLSYPKSLWAAWGVNKVTSPRICGAPSRHQELGVQNTTAAVTNISQAGLWRNRDFNHLVYLVHYVGIQQNHAEVVHNHGCVEAVGLAVCHQARPNVQGEEDIAQQDGGHLYGALHQGVVSDSGIWRRQQHTLLNGHIHGYLIHSWFMG